MVNKNEVATLLREVIDGGETIFDFKEVDGVRRIEVARQMLPSVIQTEEIPIARADARAHEFHDIESFADYCNRNCNATQSIALADCEEMQIQTVLDESIERGRETISFHAKTHPLFKCWNDLIHSGAVSVQDFAKFVQQNRRTIAAPDGRECAMMFSQIKLSKTITVQRGTGRKSLNGVMIQTEIAGQKQDMQVDLPEELELCVPVFIGTDPVRIVIDVMVTERRESEVVVIVTCADLQAIKIAAFESFVATFRSRSKTLIGLGRIESTEWEHVPQMRFREREQD